MKKLILMDAFAASSAFADQEVTLNFAAEIASQPFSCSDTYNDLGSTKTSVIVRDFRMYLSNIHMTTADDKQVPVKLDKNIWQNEAVALLDFENGVGNCTNGTPQTNTKINGSVPNGNYTGISFQVGVPFEYNHADPTLSPSPLNLTSMFWNWRGGYKFARIDFVPMNKSKGGPKGWFLHLGSTMCKSSSKTNAPTSCANSNRMNISFDNFDPKKDTIIIDPAPVVAEADLSTNAPKTSPGCMSFPNDPGQTPIRVKSEVLNMLR
jgi:uncharacterized repeat protein (TIGR04052 family)